MSCWFAILPYFCIDNHGIFFLHFAILCSIFIFFLFNGWYVGFLKDCLVTQFFFVAISISKKLFLLCLEYDKLVTLHPSLLRLAHHLKFYKS